MNDIAYIYLKDVAEINFILSTAKPNEEEALQWITASHLLPENRIIPNFDIKPGVKDTVNKVCKNDILIKRISPIYVNYIDVNYEDVYAYNNLIIIRPNSAIDSKYLACIINQQIEKLSVRTSVGAVIPSLGKNELGALKVPNLSGKEQKKIGALWYLGMEKKKCFERFAELQNIKDSYVLSKYIAEKTGGN